MNRNVNSRFALNPTNIDISRSSFKRDCSIKTSFNVGEVIPFYIDEVLPGDTFQVATSRVVRLQTLLTPMMDNLYLDMYYYFVPNRLVWEHWKQFMGENTESAWLPQTEYTVPQVVSPDDTGFEIGTIADYLGVPTGVPGLHMSALPFRAVALVMNEWFRDENLQDPLVIPMDDSDVTGSNGSNWITDLAKGGKPYLAGKYRDYFTSALPAPQRGPDVTISPLDVSPWPVSTMATDHDVSGVSLHFLAADGSTPAAQSGYAVQPWIRTANSTGTFGFNTADTASSVPQFKGVEPVNLYAQPADLIATTINELRFAFQLQKFYEKDARGGSRYIEILKAHFGVTSPDSRLQRPEYLGGNRIPININQVIQQSATEESGTPQGNTAAFSLTTDRHGDFIHSFVEHGFVIGFMVARYNHTYQQGLERFWSRKGKFDYYWPVFANIGEQAIRNKEIFAQADSVVGLDGVTPVNDEVFGYQEAWADYRYKPSRVSGEMRSAAPQSLDVWHLADDYESLPSLSASWIVEDKTNVDRVLAVSSSVSNQLFADIYIQNITTRAMPMYSIPGLIDHH